MASTVYKSKAEIPTIDVALVTIEVDSREFGFDTANSIEVEPQLNETDPVQLVIKSKLKAQKRGTTTLTGNRSHLPTTCSIPSSSLSFRVARSSMMLPSQPRSSDTSRLLQLAVTLARLSSSMLTLLSTMQLARSCSTRRSPIRTAPACLSRSNPSITSSVLLSTPSTLLPTRTRSRTSSATSTRSRLFRSRLRNLKSK